MLRRSLWILARRSGEVVHFRTPPRESILQGMNLLAPHHARRLCSVLLLLAAASCGGTTVLDDTGESGGGSPVAAGGQGGSGQGGSEQVSGQGGSAPLTCEPEEGDVVLVPAADNPEACQGRVECFVFFGHGQHLSCPGIGVTEGEVQCTIWDCVCTIYEVDDFAANFATGEVVDGRDPAVPCRYTLEPSG